MSHAAQGATLSVPWSLLVVVVAVVATCELAAIRCDWAWIAPKKFPTRIREPVPETSFILIACTHTHAHRTPKACRSLAMQVYELLLGITALSLLSTPMTHLPVSDTPARLTPAPLRDTCLAQTHLPRSDTPASLRHTCPTQTHLPASDTPASLRRTCLAQARPCLFRHTGLHRLTPALLGHMLAHALRAQVIFSSNQVLRLTQATSRPDKSEEQFSHAFAHSHSHTLLVD
eukprot:1160957-Pelagomonas_calceolata.AAC.1